MEIFPGRYLQNYQHRLRERDENGDIIRIWLKFPKSCGRKQATKLRNLSARLNLDDDAVPITSQTSSVALNNNKTIIAKRKHFPLVSALAMTIHKSQGGTYDAIVYEYDRKHPRELVYVALSRVTKIEGLFMVTKENTEDSWKFWIGRSEIPLNASESDKHLKRSTKRDENGDIIRIWLKFPKSCGRKQATKLRNLSARLNLDDDAVPITSQTSSVALNNNKTIIAKRKHFPLVSALAMTIHKSQGGTYDAIVYEYDRKHPRELVYVALSRVTKIEGLFMVTKENTEDSWKFWIGRSGIPLNASESDKHLKRSTSHREDLTLELKD
ncbi:uvrD_C_2 domain-containing protein [Trichonephila clavipes]|nr:uvrD_C_2 domain-containing protein [Trichonephila clavipes]